MGLLEQCIDTLYRRMRSRYDDPERPLDVYRRALAISEGRHVKTQEMPAHVYLKRLKPQEQQNLLAILRLMRTNEFQSYNCFYPSILAFGTTTYPDTYWQKTKKALAKEPSLDGIVNRQGEDIDLRLVCDMSQSYDHAIERMKLLFDNHDISYTYSTDCDWGVDYLDIPEAHRHEHDGKKLLRMKGDMFHMPNFVIKCKQGRDLHLYIGPMWGRHNAFDQILYERAQNQPFSILTRGLDIKTLQYNLKRANGGELKTFLDDCSVAAKDGLHMTKNLLREVLKRCVVINKKEMEAFSKKFRQATTKVPF